MLLASAMVAAGLAISGLSLAQLQATYICAIHAHPLAESKPGGDRPTTPAPEPARPDPDAQKAGATPALPPAPAEKTATPIKEK